MANKKKKKHKVAPQAQNTPRVMNLNPNEVKNDELKDMIVNESAKQSPSNQARLFELLKAGLYLVPIAVDPKLVPTAGSPLPPNIPLRHLLVTVNEKDSYVPVFTDLESGSSMPTPENHRIGYVIRTFKELEKMVSDSKGKLHGIVINPNTKKSFFLPKESLAMVLRGEQFIKQAPTTPTQEYPVRYVEPSVYPTAVANAVYETCVTLGNVERAWLKAAVAGPMVSYVIFVEQEKKEQSTYDAIQQAAMTESKEVPIVVMEATKKVQEEILKDDVPLYDKELEL